MMKRIIIYGLFVSFCLTAAGQTNLLTVRYNEPLSPSESRYLSVPADIDVALRNRMYANPAFYSIESEADSMALGKQYNSAIMIETAKGKTDGDFLLYQGNASRDVRMQATGAYTLKNAGTLFGFARYSRGRQDGIGWSATRFPELYQPYAATDSVGGDFHFESYAIKGGFAFGLGLWNIGVLAAFMGEQAHRKTDPRSLNNTTWLTGEIGAARVLNGGHLLMLGGGIGRNKQHMSLRFWRPGEQERFFVSYGFGQVDNRQSPISFGYSRMYYITRGNAMLHYSSPAAGKIRVNASLEYLFDKMKSEESSIRDLYSSTTHTLRPQLNIDLRTSGRLSLTLFVNSDIKLRKGFENIFEEYLIDKENNIYDFRLIDTRQHYDFKSSESLAELRAASCIGSSNTVSLSAGALHFMRQETYSSKSYEIKNTSIMPYLKAAFRHDSERDETVLTLTCGRRLRLENVYRVDMAGATSMRLDLQQAFAPYAYYDCIYTSVQAEASYLRHFSRYGAGVAMSLMLTDGRRATDAEYNGTPAITSTAPMISLSPDRHNERWGSVRVFFVF